MSRITTIATFVGVLATLAIVFGGLAHAGRTDPEGRVETAHGRFTASSFRRSEADGAPRVPRA